MSAHSRYMEHLAALQGSARFRDNYHLAAVPLPRAGHLQDSEYLIGSGAFGLVFCCVRTLDVDVRFAIKVILKRDPVPDPTTTTGEAATSSSGVQSEDEEIRMIKNISILFAKRRGAVILEDEWDTEIAHFIVMSYLGGTFGDAINLLSSSGIRGSPEEKREREEGLWKIAAKFARDISFQLVLMHLVKIVHRDLSAGNIMYNVNSGNVTFTVIDFNLSKRMNELEPGRYGFPGPPNFGSLIPPDLRGSVNAQVIYDEKCDCWSFGVLLFKLLFSGRDFDQSLLTVKLLQIAESERVKTPFHLVLLLTRADPRERITMKEAFQHPWLGEFDLGFEEKREMRALLEHAEEILARNPTCTQEALNTFEVLHPRQDIMVEDDDDDVAEVAMGTTPPKGLLMKAATRAWRQKRKNEDKYATSNFSKLRHVAKEGKVCISSPVVPQTPSMSRVNSSEKLGAGSGRRDSSDKKNRAKKQLSLSSMDISELVADETGDYDEEVRSVASSQSATSSSWTSRSGASRSVSRATTPGLFGLPAAGFGLTRTLSCESVGGGGGVAGMGGLKSGSSAATPRATPRKDSDFARRDAAEAELARIQTRIANKVSFLTEKLEEIEIKQAETREAVIKDLIVRRNHRFRPLPEELRKSIYTNILTKDTSELSPRKLEDLLQEAKNVMSRLSGGNEDDAKRGKGNRPEDAVRPLLSKLQEFMNLLVRYTTARALLHKAFSEFRGRFQNVAQRIERFLKSRAREASVHVINTFQSFQIECLLLLGELDNLEWKR